MVLISEIPVPLALSLILIQMIQRPGLAEETQLSCLCYQIIAGIQLSDELSTQVMCAVSVNRGGSEENSALYIVDNNMKLRAAAAPATPGSGETETQSPLEGTLRTSVVISDAGCSLCSHRSGVWPQRRVE